MASYTGILTEHSAITDNISKFNLTIDTNDFSFLPGQYLSITLPDLEDYPITDQFHDFSIASDARKPQTVTIIYRNSDSIFKSTLQSLSVGSHLEVEGPGGIFTFDKSAGKQTWIAGGMGITPFLSMIRSDVATESKIDLWYYTKDPKDCIYKQELSQAPVTFHAMTGKVAEDNLAVDITTDLIMIAGPPKMVSRTRQILLDKGFDQSIIKTEEFSGYAA